MSPMYSLSRNVPNIVDSMLSQNFLSSHVNYFAIQLFPGKYCRIKTIKATEVLRPLSLYKQVNV